MKNFNFIFLFFLLMDFKSVAQGKINTFDNYLKNRAEKNLSLLVKDFRISHKVKVNSSGIHILNLDGTKDLSIYWKEMDRVIHLLEESSYYEMVKKFENKGIQSFFNHSNDKIKSFHYREFPTEFEDLSIALDPGHFGANREEALLEGRIMKMVANDISGEKDIEIYEAILNYQTALIIREELLKLGADVMITRGREGGAMGKNFTSWLREDAKKDVEKGLKFKDISKESYDEIVTALEHPLEKKSKFILFNFYKFLDFRARAHKINEYGPNITLMLHYNASNNNRPYGDRYYKPVSENYNMIFIPGAFLTGELEKPDSKLDFIRLLVSPDLENSALLADEILSRQKQILGVGRSVVKMGSNMEKVVNFTDFKGVYARNLVLTRMARGTLVYGETLLQDNAEEAYSLSQKNIRINDINGDLLWASLRCKQVAESYVQGVVNFLKKNKKRKEMYLSFVNAD